MAFPHALPASVSAAFLSHSEETDVYLGKPGGSGQGPTWLRWARPLTQRALDRISMCFLSPSYYSHLVLRGPELSLFCLNKISVLIFQRVGKVTELMNVGGERPQVIQLNS